MKKFLSSLLVAVLLQGCCGAKVPPVTPTPFEGITYVPITNGLSYGDRVEYYYKDEGIHYLPYDVLMSLNRPVEDGLGLYDERMLSKPERLGLYPGLDPSMGPIGITKSDYDPNYVQMAGINCATCHTTLIMARTGSGIHAFYVDGGASLFAIDRFIKEMVMSTISTMICPTEFSKFYKRYVGRRLPPGAPFDIPEVDLKDVDKVRNSTEFTALNDALEGHFKGKMTDIDGPIASVDRMLDATPELVAANGFTTLTDGAYPRHEDLDSPLKMFGYMFKRFKFFYAQTKFANYPPGSTVGVSGLGRSNPWSVTKNMLASNFAGKSEKDWPKEAGGPVTAPSIWEFDRQKWIFWSGVTNSMLERNLAQGVALVTDFNWSTHETTVSIQKLEAVSQLARKAKPAEWPVEVFGPINSVMAEDGKQIFKDNCLGCHDPMHKQQAPGSAEFNYIDVGTDPEYVKGQRELFYGKDLFTGALAPWLAKIKEGAYVREDITAKNSFEAGRLPTVWRMPKGNEIIAKPLYGIWATAPFLHNGSVISIRELLKPASQRLTEFHVGSMDYDPVNLGFINVPTYYSSVIKVSCVDGCTGNSNRGHEFGTRLSESDKDKLIEFMKAYTISTKFF